MNKIIEILSWTPLGVALVPFYVGFRKWGLSTYILNGMLMGFYIAVFIIELFNL